MSRLSLVILFFSISVSIFGQRADSVCSNFNAIIKHLAGWKKDSTKVTFPLQAKRERPKLNHPFFVNGGLYYSSKANFPSEYISEFGIDEDSKCFYTAHIGVYTKETIDEEGRKLSQKILSCINRASWQTDDPDPSAGYLFISYRPVDIVVQVLKKKNEETGNYSLVITMFRFTPVR